VELPPIVTTFSSYISRLLVLTNQKLPKVGTPISPLTTITLKPPFLYFAPTWWFRQLALLTPASPRYVTVFPDHLYAYYNYCHGADLRSGERDLLLHEGSQRELAPER